jgi:acyl-CoA synthetase (AMP-forming)/AMP-acid ligase II
MTTTMLDILARRAADTPAQLAYRYLRDGTSEHAVDCTYGELAQRVACVASGLRERGISPGQRVVLTLDPGLPYVTALFGILAVGATVVPAFPPDGRRAMARFQAIAADCRPDMVLAEPRVADQLDLLANHLPKLMPTRWWLIDESVPDPAGPPEVPSCAATSPALLQYTSGSTGAPKGIIVTHENLVSNCRVLQCHAGVEPDRVGCSWLPPYHDMGLIGTLMFCLYGGWPLVILSPLHFIQRPYRWLKAITDYGATITVAPNFSFDLCTDHVSDDELHDLDLSCLRQVFCGSETVQPTTLTRFRNRFARVGYDERALLPCYGLAEATLFVSGRQAGTPLRTVAVDTEALARGEVRVRRAGGRGVSSLVSCGRIADGHKVLIADDQGRVTAPGQVGEICVGGPNVAAGYLNRPRETRDVFHVHLSGPSLGGPVLRTGDLGFLLDGELFVTGRLKDMIVIAGRNLYPQDIEESVRAAHPKIRRAVAFATARSGGDELVVVAEYRGDATQLSRDRHDVRDAAAAAIVAEHGVRPADVTIIRVGGIPRTTSGKVRRQAAHQAYLDGTLPAVPGRPEGAASTIRGTRETAIA